MKSINKKDILSEINKSYKAKLSLLNNIKKIDEAVSLIHKAISNGGKIFFCGNGGSAADAQHLTAELLIRLRPHIYRSPIPAINLAMDSSTLTACGNDFNFNYIFSRPFDALSNNKDILVALSTSGNSKNVINVLKIANKKKIKTVSFLGFKGGLAKNYSDIPIIIRSNQVARIQEAHIFLGHYLLEKVEKLILSNK